MDQIFVRRSRADVSGLDALQPPLPEVQHVVPGNVFDRLVADNRNGVIDGFDARISPTAQLIRAFP
ncbi:hypothetical protein [Roseospira marina]|uniref:hypothetical protein n=1 Tax=Roseospira marina TaxID=140057 RepID=UPI0014789628|nr:hypothetical protein [Roseospira marina]MBB5088564.1 hypothetical protein [Roseospira marina]